MANSLETAVSKLMEDSIFKQKIQNLITEIMKDGKIDFSDTPQIILIVIESYNSIKSVKLLYNQIPQLINTVTIRILETNNLIPEDQKETFSKMIETAVKLVMIQPKIKTCLINKLPCCK